MTEDMVIVPKTSSSSERTGTDNSSMLDGYPAFKKPKSSLYSFLRNRIRGRSSSKYIFPHNDREISRLDSMHYAIRYLLHGNFNAPIDAELEKGIRVIDVGCGTGRWTIDMALDYPNSTFIGIDYVDIFPKKDIPPNCTFIRCNVLNGLPFEDDSFDFVFQRLMMLVYTPDDWRRVIRELARITKPGGVVELEESDMAIQRPPSNYLRFYDSCKSLGPKFRQDSIPHLTPTILLFNTSLVPAARGLNLSILQHLPDLLIEAGLENVKSDFVLIPLGWQGREGDLCLNSVVLAFSSFRPIIAPTMGVSDKEYDAFMRQVTEEFKQKKSWINGPHAFGWKPKRPRLL
ncbi:LOW QUALITY PROTEIN: S-adenosyl-L-methionine-dependent methyltransferase [Endogone sp. FLAS-F59071]|nr:LOW QUALITY PROTEIN: S-adenosyl-L-methionine-dependent methyltransferase [Endogone sp. FLAS-F59071]|eukprot:RUS21592.1 LOW QUALITY PROTEIN: S-adenosyl-L-methionine-dependent methyltransferase [Endogone sp. FLAS-F59071]